MSAKKYFSKIGKGFVSIRKAVQKNKKRTVTWLAIILGIFILVYLLFKTVIVASVNGTPITWFEVIKLLERQGGSQALDNLVTRKLILQEARNKGISFSQQEVDEKLSELSGYLEEQGTNLDAALELQNQTKEDLIADITIQGLVEKILAEGLQVSDEEIIVYFDENKDFFAEGATLEEVKQQISDQLKNDKLTQKFQEWLDKAKADSSIKYFRTY